MYRINNFDCLDLTLNEGKITSIFDNLTGAKIKNFHQKLTQPRIFKLYILKEGENYLYIGTTSQSLITRFRQGFKADGKNGYHGYKWKAKGKVQLYVWCFPDFNKIQIESVEAEFAFLVRKETGQWPLAQNEIHFNNEFVESKLFAENIFKYTSSKS